MPTMKAGIVLLKGMAWSGSLASQVYNEAHAAGLSSVSPVMAQTLARTEPPVWME